MRSPSGFAVELLVDGVVRAKQQLGVQAESGPSGLSSLCLQPSFLEELCGMRRSYQSRSMVGCGWQQSQALLRAVLPTQPSAAASQSCSRSQELSRSTEAATPGMGLPAQALAPLGCI